MKAKTMTDLVAEHRDQLAELTQQIGELNQRINERDREIERLGKGISAIVSYCRSASEESLDGIQLTEAELIHAKGRKSGFLFVLEAIRTRNQLG